MTCAHRCHQVDLDAGLPAGFGIPAAETGRVVDQNVDATERLVATRQEAFTAKYGSPMGDDNIWLQGRRGEVDSLNRILLSITDVTDRAVRGAGVTDQPA